MPAFAEPNVVDEDVVYDDTYYRFSDINFKKWDLEMEQKLAVFLSLCRAKAHGEEIDTIDVQALMALAEEKVEQETATE